MTLNVNTRLKYIIKIQTASNLQKYLQLNLVHTLPQAAGPKPHRVEHTYLTFSVFPLMVHWNSQQAAWRYKYERDRVYARLKNNAACVLRPAARRPHGFSSVRTRGRVHTRTSIVPSSTQVKLLGIPMRHEWKYRESWNMFNSVRSAVCGMRLSMNQTSKLILLFVPPAAKDWMAYWP